MTTLSNVELERRGAVFCWEGERRRMLSKSELYKRQLTYKAIAKHFIKFIEMLSGTPYGVLLAVQTNYTVIWFDSVPQEHTAGKSVQQSDT